MSEAGEAPPEAVMPGVYRVVSDRSAVRMTVGGIAGRISGELPIQTGFFTFGKDGSLAEVQTVIDARGLKAGGQVVMHALSGRSGLDLARFPTVTFSSTSASSAGATLDFEGMLTIKGVSRSVRFRGDIARAAGRRIVVRVEGTVDRTRFGLTVGRPLYAKEAPVRIRAVALRDQRA